MSQRVQVRLSAQARWYFLIYRAITLAILLAFMLPLVCHFGTVKAALGVLIVFGPLYACYELFLFAILRSMKVEVDREGIHTKSLFTTRLLPWNAKGYYVDPGNLFVNSFYWTGFDSANLTGSQKRWRDYRTRWSLFFLWNAYDVPRKAMIDNIGEVLAVVRDIDSDYVKKIWSE
ncbi:MAG TPA: hypothetical protein DEB39_05650 [Planctomycetaceae bacterium]|nr:hypothetical protein [Planctomycetaceae bacterium]